MNVEFLKNISAVLGIHSFSAAAALGDRSNLLSTGQDRQFQPSEILQSYIGEHPNGVVIMR